MKVAMSLLTTLVVMTVVLNVKYEGAMKRISFVFGAAMAAIFALTSCNKEISNPDEIIKDGIPFEISAASSDTKTSNDGIATNWVAGDKLNLFHAVAGSTTYTSDGSFSIAEEDLDSKKFKGTLGSPLEKGNYDWYALYPYNQNVSTPANTGTKGFVTVGGTSQTQEGNSSTAHLCDKVCPLYGVAKSVASSATPGITMNHLTSIIEVNVTNNSGADLTVSNVSFTATEDIVGTYYIDFTGQTVAYTVSGPGYVSETASLKVQNGTAIKDKGSAKFYIAIKPFTATSGNTLTVSVNGYEKVINLTKDVTFTAGLIKTINFNYNPEKYIYSTSFDYETIKDGNNVYYNKSDEYLGADLGGKTAWGITYGNWNNSNCAQLRVYKEGNYGSLYMKFDVSKATKVSYKAKVSNTALKLNTYYSHDGGATWVKVDEGKALTTDLSKYEFSISKTGEYAKNRVKFEVTGDKPTSSNYNLTIDDVFIYGEGEVIENIVQTLAAPAVTCSDQTETSLTFSWNAVANATGYKVSVDGGKTYGATQNETSYTWTGLTASTTKTLYVKAIGDNIFYADSDAASAEGTTTAGSGGGANTTTLSNANITAVANPNNSSTQTGGYRTLTYTDDNGFKYSAYAISTFHSKATNQNCYIQIKKYASNTAYYVKLPDFKGNIKSIHLVVSGSSKAMDGGGNTATIYFSSSNSTSAAGDNIVSGEGASEITIDAASLNLNTGYLTASGAVRIWEITVEYSK